MIKRYFNICKKTRWVLYYFFIVLLVLGVLDLLTPIYASKIIDYLTVKNLNLFIKSTIIIAILLFTTNLFSFFAKKLYSVFFRETFIEVHKKIINRLYNYNDEIINIPKGKIISTTIMDSINIAEIPDYIFNILLRLYKQDKGTVLIDDIKIEDYTKEVFYNNVSVVNQESFLFNMSIKDNLSLVNKDVKKQIEVCKRIGIHDLICSLPKGYNTILSENANNLSGGQKRLLSLAKTLLTNSEILLFDEVTSQLDSKTTNQIAHVLKDLKKDHTIIVITHKNEIMKLADKLIVLKNGKIIKKGTYEQLIKEE